MLLATHPQTAGEFQDAAHATGAKQQGSALAHLFLLYVEQQATTLKQVLKDLASLHNDGRDEFRKEVDAIRKERAKFVQSHKSGEQHERLKKINQSASVRLSEAVTYSKALDMGYSPDWEQSYHTIVADARLLVNASASSTRGRKAKSDLEKAKEFLAKLSLSADDRNAILEFVAGGCDDTPAVEEAPM